MICDFSASPKTTIRPTGTISAPPTPCSTRSATRAPRLELGAQPSDAPVKMAIAARNTRRAPWRGGGPAPARGSAPRRAPVAGAEPAAQRDQHRERDQVGGHDQARRARRRAERAADLRDGGDDDGPV